MLRRGENIVMNHQEVEERKQKRKRKKGRKKDRPTNLKKFIQDDRSHKLRNIIANL